MSDGKTRLLLVLRARREALLLSDRATKNTVAWKRAYRRAVADLNRVVEELRAERKRKEL